jgi:aspartyl protease family protein
MLWLAALGLLAGLTWMFSALIPERGVVVEGRDGSGHLTVVLQRDPSGHYYGEGTINGQPVMFVVDTGATYIAVSEKLARQLGLPFGPRVTMGTAAGPARAWTTRLESVSVGSLERLNVVAAISTGLGDEALLGMNYLKHFNLQQEGDTLVISKGAG